MASAATPAAALVALDSDASDALALADRYNANVVWYRDHGATLVPGKWYCVDVFSGGLFDGPCDTEEALGKRAYRRNRYPTAGALLVCAGVAPAVLQFGEVVRLDLAAYGQPIQVQ